MKRCANCMREITEAVCEYCGFDNESIQNDNGMKRLSILKDRYQIGKMIGQGGFGITYVGFDMLLNRKVAVKEYYPTGQVYRNHTYSNHVQWSSSQITEEQWKKGCDSFLKEARKMAQMDEIPDVAHVKDVFTENNTAYIVMDFVEGITLKKWLLQNGTMKYTDCLKLFLPLIGHLEEIHQVGIIHRDISPDNIMLRPNGKICLLDFGAAKDFNIQQVTGRSSMVAKDGFAPCEQYLSSGKTGSWTDVHALCATLYYCIFGKVIPNAFDRMEKDEVSYDLPVREPLPDSLVEVLKKGMAVRPADRIQTMAELKRQLEKVMAKESASVSEERKEPKEETGEDINKKSAEERARESERAEKEAEEKARERERAEKKAEEKARERERAEKEAEERARDRERAEREAGEKTEGEPQKKKGVGPWVKSHKRLTILVCVGIAVIIFLCAAWRRPDGSFSVSEYSLPDEVWKCDDPDAADYYILENGDSGTTEIRVNAFSKGIIGDYPRISVSSSDNTILSVEDVENGESYGHDIRLKAKQTGDCSITVQCGRYSETYRFIVTTQEEYEAKQETDAIREAETGDLVTYGHYEQDNDLENGSESIEWIVLDKWDDGVLLISRYILDAMKYDDSGSDDWEDSDIRSWLNTDFYEEAFSGYEQNAIVLMSPTTDGNRTEDYVFLLAGSNAEDYFDSDTERQCEATAYAEEQGVTVFNETGMGKWWLRDKTDSMKYAYLVSYDGDIMNAYPDRMRGVRPVIVVNPE